MHHPSPSSFLRRLALMALSVGALAQAPQAFAQEAAVAFPTKPVRLMVPFPPGGAADTFARFLGDKLSQAWSQPVLVENRPGGGGIVASQAVARAPADGYTLLVVTVGHAVNPHLYAKLPYDTEKDLPAVARIATLPSVLVVNPNVTAKSVGELIALAKSQPGKLTYASSGNASTSHVAGVMLTNQAKVNLVHVPYKGSAAAITDLIGGQVDMIIDPLVSSAQHIKSGKLRALAISTPKRSPLAPELPTMLEAGVQGYDFSAWFVLLSPSGLPANLTKKINDDVQRIMSMAETRDKFTTMGAEPGQGSPQEVQAFISSESRRFGELVRASGMRAD